MQFPRIDSYQIAKNFSGEMKANDVMDANVIIYMFPFLKLSNS